MSKEQKAKVIITYLVNGNPNGVQVYTIPNQTCKAVVVPRSSLKEAQRRDELHQPALYLLVNKSDQKVYIGESENFMDRLYNHNRTKEFWEEAIAFISADNSITKADVKYLEYLGCKESKLSADFTIEENKTSPNSNNLPEHQLAVVEEFFEDIRFLSSFVGVPIFDKPESKRGKELFFCKKRGAEAKGYYSDGRFVVLKSSRVPISETNSYQKKEWRQEKLKQFGSVDGEVVEVIEDITFNSPSTAGGFCTGHSTNGWTAWINKDGKTLDEMYRALEDKETNSDNSN